MSRPTTDDRGRPRTAVEVQVGKVPVKATCAMAPAAGDTPRLPALGSTRCGWVDSRDMHGSLHRDLKRIHGGVVFVTYMKTTSHGSRYALCLEILMVHVEAMATILATISKDQIRRPIGQGGGAVSFHFGW